LRALIAAELISVENGATEYFDENGKVVTDAATCGTCGMTWNDALITSRTPTPSARCPYEHIHTEIAELRKLERKQPRSRAELTKDEQFFYDNAGYSYDPKKETAEQGKVRCARSMASDERVARDMGVEFEWEYDAGGCSGCDCNSPDCACSTGKPHETLVAFARYNGEVVASCGGICGATSNYRRVMEAELAGEALETIRTEGARVNA
jgi:hypothetical protein